MKTLHLSVTSDADIICYVDNNII